MGMDGAVRHDGLKDAAATVDAAALDNARFGFERAQPHRSAHRVFYITQILAIAAVIAGFVWAIRTEPGLTFGVLHVAALITFGGAILVRLVAASSLERILWRLADPKTFPTYTILCPLYHEANVVADLVAALEKFDYPGVMPQSVKSDTGGCRAAPYGVTGCQGLFVERLQRF